MVLLPFHLESHSPNLDSVGGKSGLFKTVNAGNEKPKAARALLTDKRQGRTSSGGLCKMLTPQVHGLEHLGSSWWSRLGSCEPMGGGA